MVISYWFSVFLVPPLKSWSSLRTKLWRKRQFVATSAPFNSSTQSVTCSNSTTASRSHTTSRTSKHCHKLQVLRLFTRFRHFRVTYLILLRETYPVLRTCFSPTTYYFQMIQNKHTTLFGYIILIFRLFLLNSYSIQQLHVRRPSSVDAWTSIQKQTSGTAEHGDGYFC